MEFLEKRIVVRILICVGMLVIILGSYAFGTKALRNRQVVAATERKYFMRSGTKRKRIGIAAAVVLSVVIVIVGVAVFLDISHNAFLSELGSYIRKNYSVVKSVKHAKFENTTFNTSVHSRILFYVEPDCTFEQAREIFEDFVNHFTDDFIVKLREAKGSKNFLNVDFIEAGTDLSMYSFETSDTENFVHWRATRGYTEYYEYDRQID